MAGLTLEPRLNLGDYNLEEQTAIVRHGLATLRKAGASNVIAMRAGNMGGNVDTPSAAWAAGLSLDLSFDPSRGRETRALLQAMRTSGSKNASPTIPLSFVRDYPGHYRPAQLTALSFRELQGALIAAERDHWPCFVILLHSFELVRRPVLRSGRSRPDRTNIERWNQLCAFLAQHRDRFSTVGCADLKPAAWRSQVPKAARTLPLDTARRMAEQLASRFM